MIPAFTHLALHVRDLEACIDFYRDYCGMKLVHERFDAGLRVVWLAEPGKEKDFIIVMLPGGPGRDQGEGDFSHLAEIRNYTFDELDGTPGGIIGEADMLALSVRRTAAVRVALLLTRQSSR